MLTGLGKNGLRAGIGPALEALAAPEGAYADIEALDPTVFLQLRYPVYNEEFVLFQDPACTTPVTVAGQHTIGGVKNPFTGAIIATQPTAAARPMWDGITVGATFDGTNHLVLESFSFPSTAMTSMARVKPTSIANLGIFGLLDATGADAGGFGLNLRDFGDPDLSIRASVSEDGVSTTVITDRDSVPINTSLHLALRFDSSESRMRIYSDGTEVNNRSATETDITPNHAGRGIGAAWISSGGGQYIFQFNGAIEWVSIHDAALTPTEINSTVDDGTTVDVRQITDWADAGTGTVDGELLLLTNSSNQDAIFQWDEAGSEWELVSTFDTSFDADSTVDANLYPTDFRGTQNFRNPPPTVAGALAAWDFRYDDLAVGDAYSSVTDLIGSLDAAQGTSSSQPIKDTQSGYPGEYAVFDGGNDHMEAGVAADWDSLAQGDGFIYMAVRFHSVSTRNKLFSSTAQGSDTGVLFQLESSGTFLFAMDPGGIIVETSPSFSATSFTWYTVGVSWEGTTLKWWVDGAQLGADDAITSSRATSSATHPVHLGSNPPPFTTSQPLNGDLASVFVSVGGHPSTAEVAALHDWMMGA